MTGTITLYIASSLDGYIADEDGGVSWLEEFDDSYEEGIDGGSYASFFNDVDCLVMGSTTYEHIRSFGDWPYDRKPTYVVTGRELPTEHEYVELYDGEISALGGALRSSYDHIWLVGGAELAQAFLRANILDELRLSLIPVLLGDGISLFGPSEPHDLHLKDVTAYASGIVELWYQLSE